MARIRTPRAPRSPIACLVASFALLAPLAPAQDGAFPDEWFYRGAERPAPLRALEGQPAPAISIAEWRGESLSLDDARGKVVVLDFWATWCGPCMAAIPKNIELVDRYGDDQLVFLGVHDSKNGWDKVDSVIADKGIDYPVGKDDGGQTTKAYALQFWPTYVVIDKKGVVRGAGLLPDKVGEAVERLIAEDGPAVAAEPVAGSFPDDWFLGGEKRSPALRAAEGKPAPRLVARAWAGDEPPPEAFDRRIVVYQFVKPELSLTYVPLRQVSDVAMQYAEQGVTFVAVCDARSDFDAAEREKEARGVPLPIAQDAESADDEGAAGAFAHAMGVKLAPATVVVDRAGIVRAAGLDPKRLRAVLDRLLVEPAPLPSEPRDAAADEPK